MPLCVQWHPVEKPLSSHEGVSVLRQTCRRTPLWLPLAPPPYVLQQTVPRDSHLTCLLPPHQHHNPRWWSHHLLSHMIGFTMVDPPGIVCRKSILPKMFPHDLLRLSFPVCTFAAGTANFTRSFSSHAKCPFQESIGLVDPFIGDLTLTCVACVHPLMVLHPLTYIAASNININTTFLLSNR